MTSFGFRSRLAGPGDPRPCRIPRLPLAVAYSDIARFCPHQPRGTRLAHYLTPSPAGSLHEVEMVFTDPINHRALDGGAGMTLPEGGRVALTAESKHQGTPDEDRVTRKLKKGESSR